MESNGKIVNRYEEKAAKTYSGFMMLALVLLLVVAGIALLVVGVITLVQYAELMGDEDAVSPMGIALLIGGILVMTLGGILCAGFKTINPNEAIVLTLFGKYYGTIKKDGFYWTNIFCGGMNPGAGHNAVFNVQNYQTFLSTQCDSATRNIARMYPYDLFEEDDQNEKTLRGSSQEIAAMMTKDLQERVAIAGLEILEVRITHLSYAPEIAAAMLQRQQAEAVVAARKKIVEGAVGMVEMALDQLSEDQVVALDDERKAAMVSNLLVVLCGSKDAQPVVNSGSIY